MFIKWQKQELDHDGPNGDHSTLSLADREYKDLCAPGVCVPVCVAKTERGDNYSLSSTTSLTPFNPESRSYGVKYKTNIRPGQSHSKVFNSQAKAILRLVRGS